MVRSHVHSNQHMRQATFAQLHTLREAHAAAKRLQTR